MRKKYERSKMSARLRRWPTRRSKEMNLTTIPEISRSSKALTI